MAEELRRLLALPGPTRRWWWTRTCAPRAARGRWCGRWPPTGPTTQRWSRAWEAQALLRAEPVAGDAELGERFTRLVDELRYPDGGIPDAGGPEIRRLKARMEAERHAPRRRPGAAHSSSAPAGCPTSSGWSSCCSCGTRRRCRSCGPPGRWPALAAAARPGLVTPEDAAVLAASWRLATRIRDAVVLVRGRAADALPARHGGTGARWPPCSATRRARARTWCRTTAGPRAGPAP